MKKIKLFLCVALFGAMSFGALSAYDYLTMSAEERALLENIEALTSGETSGGGGSGTYCYDSVVRNKDGFGGVNKCDNQTSPTDCTQYPGYRYNSTKSRNCVTLR